jgi:hypothetical protein
LIVSTEREELTRIIAKVEAVERENRKLKRMILSAVVVAGAVLLMGQARPNRTIEAEKFVLKDANGKIRARLEMESDSPTLALLDGNGFPAVSLLGGDSPFLTICADPTHDSIAIVGCDQQVQIGRFSKEQFGIALYGKDEGGPLHGILAGLGVHAGVPALDLWGRGASEHASLNLDAPGPSLDLSDKQGFMATIGSTDLGTPRAGEIHKTSAASIVLLDKGGNVLWSAP